MKKMNIAIITLFTIVITFLSLLSQWSEFYNGYSYYNFNLFVSIVFLMAWLLFSFYWGIIQEEKYQKFMVIYWSVGIASSIAIWILSKTKLTSIFLSPFYTWAGGLYYQVKQIASYYGLFDSTILAFYTWFGGPLYGFRSIFFSLNGISIDRPTLMLITSPLYIIFCFIGYKLGGLVSRVKKSQYS
ncbi:MAG: hypothetical protein Q8936_19255 [Bacillota bacterium]|nr:hypothetical protein [Bacillota bacterium]